MLRANEAPPSTSRAAARQLLFSLQPTKPAPIIHHTSIKERTHAYTPVHMHCRSGRSCKKKSQISRDRRSAQAEQLAEHNMERASSGGRYRGTEVQRYTQQRNVGTLVQQYRPLFLSMRTPRIAPRRVSPSRWHRQK